MKIIRRKKLREIEHKGEKLLGHLIITAITFLISIPIFIIVYRYVPDLVLNFNQPVRLDHILTGIVIFATVRFLLSLVEQIVIWVGLVALILLSVSHFTSFYTYGDMMHRYKDLVNFVESNPVNIPFVKDERMTIRNAREIREMIDYQNPEVRNYAIKLSQIYFTDPDLKREYGKVPLYFSIFKSVNDWNYIPDPKGEEYYAKASESLFHLSGDCDDHSILMAACIKAVGGEARLVHTKNHLYPEVKICHIDDLDKYIHLIKRELFLKESLGGQIFYHLDSDDNVWLNFDYTTSYPGGEFMDEQIIGILVI